jgi:signal transduction histidine kinase
MVIAIILLLIAVTGLITYIIVYKRQVRSICRQLCVNKEIESNTYIRTKLDDKELLELTTNLNQLVEDKRKTKADYLKKEENISDIYTAMAHDIRTPLTSLGGYFTLLNTSETQAEREEYLRIIHERLTSLNEMLEELFMFAKLRDDSYEMSLKKIDLSAVLRKKILSYYNEWKQKEIVPVIKIPDESIFVNANEGALDRIVGNLIKNALVHGERNLEIRILKLKNNKVCLEFTNDIPEALEIDSGRVFERFYKADSARNKTSSGLGLAIVKELAVKMDAGVYANIEAGKFTTGIQFFCVEQ